MTKRASRVGSCLNTTPYSCSMFIPRKPLRDDYSPRWLVVIDPEVQEEMKSTFKAKLSSKITNGCSKRVDWTEQSLYKKIYSQMHSKIAKSLRRENDRFSKRPRSGRAQDCLSAQFKRKLSYWSEADPNRLVIGSYRTLYLSDSHPLGVNLAEAKIDGILNQIFHRIFEKFCCSRLDANPVARSPIDSIEKNYDAFFWKKVTIVRASLWNFSLVEIR